MIFKILYVINNKIQNKIFWMANNKNKTIKY